MEQRNYGAAVAALNSLQSNFATVNKIQKSGRSANQHAIPEMIDFFRRIGYEPSDLDRIRPIHIAGTKGKGSTSAFISSILSQYTPGPLHKIGLYTSPHLRFVRERIQINNEPLSESLFAKYFFEVWDKLSVTGDGSKPMYFRYLTLMALHTFMSEGVDSAVIECGIGGEYDSTNVLVGPTVTAITSLGIDHVGMLGPTIEEIAWHKAGIFKKGAMALTSQQPQTALEVLRKRAAEKGTELHVVGRHPQIERGEVKLGLAADFQKTNAGLAIAAAAGHLRALGHASVADPIRIFSQPLPPQFIAGLERVKWGGRCEIRHEPSNNLSWYLDGGHTLDSIKLVGQWFASEVRKETDSVPTDVAQTATPRVLIFNQQTKERDAASLSQALFSTLQSALHSDHPFTLVIFTTNVTSRTGGYKPDLLDVNVNAADVEKLKVQNELAAVWRGLDRQAAVTVTATIEGAIETARQTAREVHMKSDGAPIVKTLITGSLHLVGGALEVLESGS